MNNKKQYLLLLTISLLVLTISLSYAYYSAVVQGTGNTNAETSANTANIGEVEFNGTSTFDSSTLDDIYPGFIGIQTFTISPYKNGSGIYEIDLAATVPEAFGTDIKLTLYKTSNKTNNNIEREEGSLTINNNKYSKQDTLTINGTLTKVYEGSLVTTTETRLEQVEFAIGGVESTNFTTPDVTPDGYYTYYAVYEYLDNGNQNSQQGLDFDSKITVKYIGELIPAMVTLNSLKALNPSFVLSESTSSNPDFSLIAPRAANVNNDGKAEQTSGLFELEDDYGPSYYFRGDITNNYVKFGKWKTDYYNGYESTMGEYYQYTSLSACETMAGSGMCIKYANAGDDMYWRIVRINGDGSIRMIYDGTRPHGKNDMEYDMDNLPENYRNIGISRYNRYADDNAYAGYMYGTLGSNNYNDTHANINNSAIKTYIDTWYENNFLNTSYETYLADEIFCNDRSVASATLIQWETDNNNDDPTFPYTANAFGTNKTLYAPRGRLIEQDRLHLGNKATLKCPQKHDAFTVSDTTYGNGDLTYPTGLLTIDEANMAGLNENCYLTTGALFYTGSPFNYESPTDCYGACDYPNGYQHIIVIQPGGFDDAFPADESNGHAIRPVINLKTDSITGGDGTASNPFVVN